ncbi:MULTISPECIES: hypothetical protein [Halomonadaceae]|nr:MULTISPECIES: hypothetical protein [Halomonas]
MSSLLGQPSEQRHKQREQLRLGGDAALGVELAAEDLNCLKADAQV